MDLRFNISLLGRLFRQVAIATGSKRTRGGEVEFQWRWKSSLFGKVRIRTWLQGGLLGEILISTWAIEGLFGVVRISTWAVGGLFGAVVERKRMQSLRGV